MYYAKNLVFISVYLGILLSGQKSFRGLEKDQLFQTQVPLSFMHHIASNYDVVPQQLNPVRGSYLIIARDGLVQEGYIDYFSDFKKSQGFDVVIKPISDSDLEANNIKSFIADQLVSDPMLEYVLLIGDVDGFADIPSYYYGPENDVTDQKYTHLEGSNNIITSLACKTRRPFETFNCPRREHHFNTIVTLF